MQPSPNKLYAPWAAGLGLLGLLAAAVAALIYRQFNTVVQVTLVVGLLGLVLAMFLSPGTVTAWAGLRQTRYGTNALVMTIALLGILVLVNYLVTRTRASWDLSEGQINTLAPQTVEALQQLPAPVTVVGFFSDQVVSQRNSARDLLERYRKAAPDKFSYEFVDPYADPVRANAYQVATDGTLFVEQGAQRQQLSFASETELTSALVRLVQPTSRVLYFVTGQGEGDPEDTSQSGLSEAVDLLKRQNYEIKPLNLQVTSTIPADARAIVVAGPQTAWGQPAAQAVSDFLAQNQNVALVALLDPPVQNAQATGAASGPAAPDALTTYLATTWGVIARDDIVVDLANGANTTNGQNPLWPVYVDFPSSALTANLSGQAVVFPLARTISTTTGLLGATFTPVIQSGPAAWGEIDLAGLQTEAQPAAGPGDAPGPLTLAVAAENTAAQTRLVVFGDSDFARNSFTQGTANTDLFVAAVNWATRDEALIDLTPKIPTQRTLQVLDALTANTIFFFTVIAMPALILVLGGVVWFMRRRHT